ncbi:MAG TPA: HAD family hydrolase [Opitutaceae bacterium]|nr:HAD family hydrolase [Opitutaceae bacterium]
MGPALAGYRHLIWDWNGTLLDDLDLCVEVMNSLLAPRSLPLLDRARYRAAFDFPVRDYYARLGFDFRRESFEAVGAEFIATYERRRGECALHDGALSLLAAVQAGGATQSILSAYHRGALREFVGHFGLAPFFLRLNGPEDIYAHGKLELGRNWIRELGLPPAEVLMIGDTLHDAETARAMGVACVLVAAGHHAPERLRGAGVPVYSSLAALAAG